MEKELQDVLNVIIAKIDEQSRDIADVKGIVLKLENNMSTRIESLFDGYKLAHEKQWELERKMEELERRLAALEEKTA